MKKFYFVFVLCLLFVTAACGSKKADEEALNDEDVVDAEPVEEEISDEDEAETVVENDETAEVPDSEPAEEEKKQGELGGECYPNETCNKGLECDIKNNICIEETIEPADDSDTSETTDDSDTSEAADDSDTSENADDSDTLENADDSDTSETADDSDIDNEPPEKTPAEKCVEAGGSWDEADTLCQKTVLCSAIPQHSEYNSVDRVTQTWDGTSWSPSSTAVYNDETSSTECRFKCKEKYFWNGEECVSPCDPNPCDSDENSTHECIAHALDQYECKCNDNYFWRDGICREPMSVGNVCTGLTKCYTTAGEINCSELGEEFPGEDAAAAEAGQCTPPSFTPGDGSIEEQVVILDNNTRLEWQQDIPNETYLWEKAKEYCETLNYGGQTGWRLPTPKELYTIVDNSRKNPAIDPDFFPGTPSDYFWTSVALGDDHVWGINFSSGSDNALNIASGVFTTAKQAYVRCVHGEPLKNSQFIPSTVAGNTFYTDSTTGLKWQKTSVSKSWQNALKYCEDLTYAGYSDWRLPNKNELISIINFEKGALPFTDLPDAPSSNNYYYWSSSTSATSTSSAWIVGAHYQESSLLSSFEAYIVQTAGVTNGYYARCVRN